MMLASLFLIRLKTPTKLWGGLIALRVFLIPLGYFSFLRHAPHAHYTVGYENPLKSSFIMEH